MGLFSRFFGNGQADLDRATACLSKGEYARALQLATRAAAADGGALRTQAEAVVDQARRGKVKASVAKADQCEATHPQDAIDWLEMALEDARDLSADESSTLTPASLSARRDALIERLQQQSAESRAQEMLEQVQAVSVEADDADDDEPIAMDYDVLVGTLRDDLQDAYDAQPTAFRDAFVAISEGRAEAALDALGALDDDDPLVRLERGRARMLIEQHEAAAEDFEAVWPHFGDQPIDHQGLSSVPLLWADAGLAAGRHDDVADRLATLGGPVDAGVPVTDTRAQALLAAERVDEAQALLAEAVVAFPKVQGLRHRLATALAKNGARADAISVLDAAVAACCSGGSCAGQPMHAPSLQLLATLLLDDETMPPQRILDTINMAIHARGGVSAPLARLQERYYLRVGEPDQAATAAAIAEKLTAAGKTGGTVLLTPTMGAGSGAIL